MTRARSRFTAGSKILKKWEGGSKFVNVPSCMVCNKGMGIYTGLQIRMGARNRLMLGVALC